WIEENIFRRDVAVDETVAMNLCERACELGGDREHARLFEGTVPERRGERGPLHIFHHQVWEAVRVAERDDRREAGMAQAAEDRGFAAEVGAIASFFAVAGSGLARGDFDGEDLFVPARAEDQTMR